MNKHSILASTIAEIVDYWARRQDECGLSVDWAEAHERCWRCGEKSKLERCHIVPRSLGGADSPENLVLLCFRCHREAPNVDDASFMWQWLRAHAVPFYDTYWTLRAIAEFEKLFKRKPFNGTSPEISPEKVDNLISSYMRKASWHYGEGGFNPSTIAWVLTQVERDIVNLDLQNKK
jgi:hypothetical protein